MEFLVSTPRYVNVQYVCEAPSVEFSTILRSFKLDIATFIIHLFRAHRLGQTRKVHVYRLITKGTIEEKVMGYQKFKQNTADVSFSVLLLMC